MSLDPTQNRLAREAEQAAGAEKIPPLDPPFPFRAIAFDPFAFGAQLDPPVDTSLAER